MRISFKELVFFILLLLLLIPAHTARAGEEGLRKVTLQLKWKHQFQFAGYYAAVEKGFYREAGLEVNIREAVAGTDSNEEVFNGNADFGISSSEVLILRSKHRNAVVLASIFQHSPLVLLALEKSGIRHAGDLVGKRVAFEPNSGEIVAFLRHEGFSMDQFIIKHQTLDLEQLINGEVDAITAYSSNETFTLEEAGIPYTVLSPLMAGLDFYGDVLFTTAELIEKEPEMVRKFREASLKGWDYALQH
jgi:ABC-type nitrate/sulfonate/bicarbonate transport system substrate-binding protein